MQRTLLLFVLALTVGTRLHADTKKAVPTKISEVTPKQLSLPPEKVTDCYTLGCSVSSAEDVKFTRVPSSFVQMQYARPSCCNHQGGICGCSGTQAICCDGGFDDSRSNMNSGDCRCK